MSLFADGLNQPITLALIDDHAAMRTGLRAILAATPGFDVVASGARVPEALMQTTQFDIAILDLRLSDGSSVEMNVKMLQSTDAIVLAYSSGESPSLLREAAAGVGAIMQKNESIDRLVEVIRDLARGEVVASTEWAAALDGDNDFVDAKLTDREREVLALYASGEQADRVAMLLFISRDTVIEHVKRIRAKYLKVGRSAPTKVHLHQRALEDGLL